MKCFYSNRPYTIFWIFSLPLFKIQNHVSEKQYNTITRASYQKGTKMNYDDILEELGELGPWQILHLLLLWIPAAAGGMWVLTYTFAGTVFQMYWMIWVFWMFLMFQMFWMFICSVYSRCSECSRCSVYSRCSGCLQMFLTY